MPCRKGDTFVDRGQGEEQGEREPWCPWGQFWCPGRVAAPVAAAAAGGGGSDRGEGDGSREEGRDDAAGGRDGDSPGAGLRAVTAGG